MSTRVLKMIHCLTGSHWRGFKVGVTSENLEAPETKRAKQIMRHFKILQNKYVRFRQIPSLCYCSQWKSPSVPLLKSFYILNIFTFYYLDRVVCFCKIFIRVNISRED